MIPWNEFKIPQDAYEWAKSRARDLRVYEGCAFFNVWVQYDDGPIEVLNERLWKRGGQ